PGGAAYITQKARCAREKWAPAYCLLKRGCPGYEAYPFHGPASMLTSLPMTRRRVLAGAGLAVTCVHLPASAQPQGGSQDGFRALRAYSNTVTLSDRGPTPIWGYDG